MPSLETIGGWIEGLGDLSPQLSVGLAMVILNFIFRRIPVIPNAAILPLSCAWGMTLYVIFCPKNPNHINPNARLVLTGFFVGFFAWLMYDKIVSTIEERWPWLHGKLLNGKELPKKPIDEDGQKDKTLIP